MSTNNSINLVNGSFSPEDFKNVLIPEYLYNYFTELIIDIRKNSKYYGEALSSIAKIEELIKKKSSFYNELDQFKEYKAIIEASIEIRKLMKKYIPNIETYDSINYVFYYNGKRYYVESQNIKTDFKNMQYGWLKSKEDGLYIDIKKVAEDLDKEKKSVAKTIIDNNITRHYNSFSNAITGTYRGEPGIGQLSSKFNFGHVSEAFETHLQREHENIYRILNQQGRVSEKDLNLVQHTFYKISSWWSDHESMDDAWRHMKGSLGNQRGTVAGDTGNVQVKGRKIGADSGTLRLSSIHNLKMGLKTFSNILNPDISPREAAIELANYMSEGVKTTAENVSAFAANNAVRKSFLKEYLSDNNIEFFLHI